MKLIYQIFSTVKTESPVLYYVVLAHLLLGALTFVALLIDSRTLLGVNVWLKPFKFCVSGAIYIITLGYFMTLYPYSKIKKALFGHLVAWTLLVELLIIIFQGARGVQSHYNMNTAINGLLFAAMGILIGINVVIMLIFLIDTIRLKMKTERSIQIAILFGWVILIVGSWIGGQMISQMSHTVGMASHGEGLPLVNWSTVAGDLRVAHFFGLHGLQIIPLLAFWLHKKTFVSNKNQVILISSIAIFYASFIGYIFHQAKQGLPFLSI
ncbi:hypothetical protein [Tenacibaculum sp. SG-28]|uniref:hypothetical protein n=1 Tax=Tenacibaculum sp. SG-28 TaxID=754426 RepID=UPI000CF4B094|nr:hypothetical protein [Tenacibaculum sp. SG-28]PQJ23266.1 hypothetical protein BSU00_03360 [Tenacibaculum sp. SG-28]